MIFISAVSPHRSSGVKRLPSAMVPNEPLFRNRIREQLPTAQNDEQPRIELERTKLNPEGPSVPSQEPHAMVSHRAIDRMAMQRARRHVHRGGVSWFTITMPLQAAVRGQKEVFG